LSELLFEPTRPALPVLGRSALFPVRRIFCIGRNYAAHAREMGKDPQRDPPFFFMKPATALVPVTDERASIPYPAATTDFQHEIELVAAIGTRAACVDPIAALRHVFGYAVGLDMTRRDLQLSARTAGRPWESGKSFAYSAPTGPIRQTPAGELPQRAAIWLTVNDETRQRADIAEMIWTVAECISQLSWLDALEPGDLLFTGTPAGVGAVVPGDRLRGGVTGIGEIALRIALPEVHAQRPRADRNE
jgi:fumarylpyruvate hydrolase